MAWERIRYWQWMLVAVILGVAVGRMRQGHVDDVIGSYGESLNGQMQFEQALIRPINGHRQFENVLVTPEFVEDSRGGGGGRRFVHVVRGSFWDGRREMKDGVEQANLRPAFFVAPFPYHPVIDLSAIGDKGKEAATKFAAIERPSVVDFLAAVDHARGVKYSYAWWGGSAYATWLWVGGCVLIFGIGFPIVINLSVYGTLGRPKRVKEAAVDLSKVETTPEQRKPLVTDEDLERVAELGDELESKLASDAAGETAGAAQVVAPAAVRKLNGKALEPQKADEAKERAFGVKEDDFYPTERRAKH